MEPTAASYPATFTLDPPEKVANWRALVNWLLAIPHFLVLYGLGIVAEVVAVIAWFAILFTGKMPEGLGNIQALYIRYYTRTMVFAAFLKEEYPPFAFAATAADAGDDPRVHVDFQIALENRNRVTVFFRLLLAIPQFIVLAVLFIAAYFVLIIAFFAVLFTGRWPEGMRNFVVGVGRWAVRVMAYTSLLTDEYPPFSLD